VKRAVKLLSIAQASSNESIINDGEVMYMDVEVFLARFYLVVVTVSPAAGTLQTRTWRRWRVTIATMTGELSSLYEIHKQQSKLKAAHTSSLGQTPPL
jgi:hypothetical protein